MSVPVVNRSAVTTMLDSPVAELSDGCREGRSTRHSDFSEPAIADQRCPASLRGWSATCIRGISLSAKIQDLAVYELQLAAGRISLICIKDLSIGIRAVITLDLRCHQKGLALHLR